MSRQARLLGMQPPDLAPLDHSLEDGSVIRFGAFELRVIHTPGHSPGSVSLVVPREELCLSGDTLFKGGIGRTDLWGGDFNTIIRSIKERLFTLNGSMEVIPGHGPSTTIDYERRTNDLDGA